MSEWLKYIRVHVLWFLSTVIDVLKLYLTKSAKVSWQSADISPEF